MTFSWLSSKAETCGSNIAHRGTFAKETINRGEIIAIFGGYILDAAAWEQTDATTGSLALPLDENFVIAPKHGHETGDGDFVNHSCNPNAGIAGQIMLIAMRDIAPQEEVTFDYAMVLANIAEEHCGIRCNCGTPECRGNITADDWKDKKLQERYKGHFSTYVQKNIETMDKKSS